MPEPVAVRIPHENVNDTSALILSWLVQDGDVVQADQALAEVETSKATFEITSPAAGVIKTLVAAGTERPVGDVLCYIGEGREAIENFLNATTSPAPIVPALRAAEQRPAGREKPVPAAEPVFLPASGKSRFSRKALELMQANGCSESEFAGRGLVRTHDILARLGDQRAAEPAASELAQASSGAPAQFATDVAVRTESLPRSKRIEAKLLSWSVRDALRSSVTVAVPRRAAPTSVSRDAADAERLSAAIIFECARLLRKYPHLNGYCSGGQVHFYEQINIGCAVDAGLGLRVPVFCDADKSSLTKLLDDRRQFFVDYLNEELRPESLSGATFTITDLSGAGVVLFDPLIVEGQSAILGVGSEFGVSSDSVAYHLTLAFDHRMIEGRMAAAFLNELKQRMQAHDEGMAKNPSGENVAQESHCAQCFVTASEIRSARGFLVQVAGEAAEETTYVCTTCLQGW